MDSKTRPADAIPCKDLRPEWGIFIPAVIVIFLVSLPCIFIPAEAESFLTSIYHSFRAMFGSSYLWITILLILLCIYFACSRYGDIKFGKAEDRPEFSLPSWVAMIFCSGVVGACMFWAIIEPQWDLLAPPQHAAPMSPEAYEWSLAYLLLHWGPNAWCTYFLSALPIAYIFHIRNKPTLRSSSACEIVIGRQKDGLLGRCVDVFFIVGVLFGTAATMCVSLPTVEGALSAVFGLTPSFRLEIVILIVSAGIAGVSVYMGLKKGIERLSNLNIVIALVMIGYAFITGPTAEMTDIFTNGLGKMLGNYLNMTFWTDPFTPGTFPQDWTMFYVLFWASYGPFMGLFIARISRGRTVREVILWGMLGTIAGGYLIHGVFGSYTLYVQYHGIVDAVGILRDQGAPASMMAVLGTLPFGKIVMLVYCAFSTIFLATSVDSTCYVIASTATRAMTSDDDPHRLHRTFRAVTQAVLALGMLSIGGIGVVKMFGNFAGALMMLPVLLLVVSWFKILREDGDYMLEHNVAAKTQKQGARPLGEDRECPGA